MAWTVASESLLQFQVSKNETDKLSMKIISKPKTFDVNDLKLKVGQYMMNPLDKNLKIDIFLIKITVIHLIMEYTDCFEQN